MIPATALLAVVTVGVYALCDRTLARIMACIPADAESVRMPAILEIS